MIAQRFRPLGWVAGVAIAATGLYLVSLQVAAERGKLEAVERQIAMAQRDMRQLQTELGTRGSLRQLEKWNGDVLALSAPKARQFLHSETQLASLSAGALDDAPNAPPAVMNAAYAVPTARPVAKEPPPPARAGFAHALYSKPAAPAAKEPAAVSAGFERVAYEKPVERPRLQRVAMLDASVLTELGRSAAAERRKRP